MPLLLKSSLTGFLELQDDHYTRLCDLCFRHLAGAFEQSRVVLANKSYACISNDDDRYGRSEHLKILSGYRFSQSEEYSQAIGASIFAHVWLLSAANYYRLSCKHRHPADAPWLDIAPIARTHHPQLIAEDLRLHRSLVELAGQLHEVRNTLVHLVETDPKTAPVGNLNFAHAYNLVKGAWIIYIALLRHYRLNVTPGSWGIQTRRYGLPRSLPSEKSALEQRR